MKQSEHFRENAENCARLAEAATNQPLRMEAAWLALANEQDWLDGEVPPIDTTKQPPTLGGSILSFTPTHHHVAGADSHAPSSI
jgi:hypothetical protein